MFATFSKIVARFSVRKLCTLLDLRKWHCIFRFENTDFSATSVLFCFAFSARRHLSLRKCIFRSEKMHLPIQSGRARRHSTSSFVKRNDTGVNRLDMTPAMLRHGPSSDSFLPEHSGTPRRSRHGGRPCVFLETIRRHSCFHAGFLKQPVVSMPKPRAISFVGGCLSRRMLRPRSKWFTFITVMIFCDLRKWFTLIFGNLYTLET